jgi:hypothetical protein
MTKIYQPPRFDEVERASMAWRGNLAIVDDATFWINDHMRTTRQNNVGEKYLEYVRARLADHVKRYRVAIRAVSEAEVTMTVAGRQFNREA